MGLKKALFISFISHCFILTPVGNFWFITSNKKTNDMQIIYYKTTPQITEAIKTTQIPKEEKSLQKTDLRQPSIQPINKEALTLEKIKKEKSQIVKKTKPLQVKAPDIKLQELMPSAKENILPSSIPGTTLPNTPECINYYQYIREEIRRFLKQNYTSEYEEGDVIVSFALNQKGELVSLNINEEKSCGDPVLHRLSYESIKNASPFKPFPKGLLQKQISFNLTVVFKKN